MRLNHKHFLACAIGLTQAATLFSQDKKPNIIYIMSDDHGWQAISAYKGILSKVLPTPNIDRIGEEGAILNNCFVTNSISTPSRASILTGQYSIKNGVFTLSDRLDTTKTTVAKELNKGGYNTGVFGKWHVASEPRGFDEYEVFPGQGKYYDPVLIEKGMWNEDSYKENAVGTKYVGEFSTDVVTNRTLNYLDKVKDDDQPFFVMCHFKAPHRPWQPAERFKDLFKDIEIPEPQSLYETYEGKGDYTKTVKMGLEIMDKTDLRVDLPDTLSRDEYRKQAYQLFMKEYLGCIAGIDENVGRILEYLDENNLTENTIIIYTSDQGFYLGEHGYFDKRLMFEESLKMPFLIRYPKEIKPGTINNDMFLNIDFAPTFLDYANMSAPEQMQGESFRDNLSGGKNKLKREDIYYRYWMHGDRWHNAPANYGIRNDRYKLIYYYGHSLGTKGSLGEPTPAQWELYDLKKDPKEMTNEYNNPKYQKIVKQMKERLVELKKEYGDTDDLFPQMQEINQRYF